MLSALRCQASVLHARDALPRSDDGSSRVFSTASSPRRVPGSSTTSRIGRSASSAEREGLNADVGVLHAGVPLVIIVRSDGITHDFMVLNPHRPIPRAGLTDRELTRLFTGARAHERWGRMYVTTLPREEA